MNNFGQETLDYLTPKLLNNLLIAHFRSFSRLVKIIYFNPEYPQNNIIKYDANNPQYIYVFEKDKFVSYSKEYIIDTIIMNLWTILYNYYSQLNLNTFKNTLISNETFERIQEFIEDYGKLCKGITPCSMKELQLSVYETIKFCSLDTLKKKSILQIFAREHKLTLQAAKELWKIDPFAIFIKKNQKKTKRENPNDDNEKIYFKLKHNYIANSNPVP
jgi:hypothetical protein